MDCNIIRIDIDFYRKCNKLPEHGTDFKDTIEFDRESGLSYVTADKDQTGYFRFKVIDKHRYMLAKIKYGI
jgi:hypothetical protein